MYFKYKEQFFDCITVHVCTLQVSEKQGLCSGLSVLSFHKGAGMPADFVKHIPVCFVYLLHSLLLSLYSLSISLFAVLPSLLQQVPENFYMCRLLSGLMFAFQPAPPLTLASPFSQQCISPLLFPFLTGIMLGSQR